jgi:hypothetical protein
MVSFWFIIHSSEGSSLHNQNYSQYCSVNFKQKNAISTQLDSVISWREAERQMWELSYMIIRGGVHPVTFPIPTRPGDRITWFKWLVIFLKSYVQTIRHCLKYSQSVLWFERFQNLECTSKLLKPHCFEFWIQLVLSLIAPVVVDLISGKSLVSYIF